MSNSNNNNGRNSCSKSNEDDDSADATEWSQQDPLDLSLREEEEDDVTASFSDDVVEKIAGESDKRRIKKRKREEGEKEDGEAKRKEASNKRPKRRRDITIVACNDKVRFSETEFVHLLYRLFEATVDASFEHLSKTTTESGKKEHDVLLAFDLGHRTVLGFCKASKSTYAAYSENKEYWALVRGYCNQKMTWRMPMRSIRDDDDDEETDKIIATYCIYANWNVPELKNTTNKILGELNGPPGVLDLRDVATRPKEIFANADGPYLMLAVKKEEGHPPYDVVMREARPGDSVEETSYVNEATFFKIQATMGFCARVQAFHSFVREGGGANCDDALRSQLCYKTKRVS